MKLRDFSQRTPSGTYVAVKFDKKSVNKLINFCKDHDIPDVLEPDDFHVTLIYSHKPAVGFTAKGNIDPPIVVTPDKFEIWPSQHITTEDGTHPNCLVLHLKAPKLVERHRYITDKYNTTYDFDKYHPHVTLSYNVGDFDVTDLPDPNKIGDLSIVNEYCEELKVDWGETKISK